MKLLWVVFAAWPFARELPDDHVVARAEGARGTVTITAERLRRFAAAHPGRSPRALSQELLEFELLAAEAEARGFEKDAGVRESVAAALVHRYLALVFEAEWRHETIPKDLLRQSYENNKRIFVHPALRGGIHVVVTGPEKPEIPKDSPKGPEALRIATSIAADLQADPPADSVAFRARCEAYADQAKAAGLRLQVDELGVFRQFKGRLVEDFTRVAFAVTEADTITDPFRTQFGWHVMHVTAVHPAENKSFEDVEDDLRTRNLPDVRALKLRELQQRLAARYKALVNYEPLLAVDKRRTHDEPAEP